MSTFAVQFAALGGARVIATSGSAAKLKRLGSAGANELINYRSTPEWGATVAELTGGGADHVVEVAGAGTFAQSMIAARVGGHISVVGVLTRGSGIDPLSVIGKQLTLRGITNASRESFENMNRAIEGHRLRPVIDKRFAFDDVAAAFTHLESGTHVGKVVLQADWAAALG